MAAPIPGEKLDWSYITRLAVQIVRSYDTGVTLRQLFYQLVSREVIPNSQNAYKGLSRHTAIARRAGWFPALIDRNRDIERPLRFSSPAEAVTAIRDAYRRDRTEGQDYCIYIGIEKSGIVEQLKAWFGQPLGIPILALGGYSSQSFVDEIVTDVRDDGRESVLIYAGDFDPSGEDIDRDFKSRTACWDHEVRVALTPQQVIDHNLPPLPGKMSDSRAAGFIARHGRLMQVEVDALDPNLLRGFFDDEIANWWDDDPYQACLVREKDERDSIVVK